MESATRIQILDQLLKEINPFVLPLKYLNSKGDWFLKLWLGNQFRRKKTFNSNQLYSILKLTLCSIHPKVERLHR